MHRQVPGKVELMEETQTFFSLEKLSQGGETAPTYKKRRPKKMSTESGTEHHTEGSIVERKVVRTKGGNRKGIVGWAKWAD